MTAASWQAATLIALLGVAGTSLAAPAGRYARQLADECDALIDSAVKRPYGWAWTTQTGAGVAERKPQVEMRPPGTPAAGLVLLWSGVLLEEPRYVDAAMQAARGVAASQTANGNIVSEPTFGPTPGKREPPANVPDRAATRAGVALLLAVVGADESKDEMFRRAAIRAAAWLSRQQAQDGGWPSAAPEEAASAVPARLIRLDERDVRDSIFALLLSASVADDRTAARAAAKSTEKLLGLRLSAPGKWSNLWTTFYRLDGSLEERLMDFPPGADMLASRRAIEALLAGGLILSDGTSLAAARDAAKSIRTLQGTHGTWNRLYILTGQQPQPVGESIFADDPARAYPDELWKSGTFGIDSVLQAIDQLQHVGPAEMLTHLSASATIQQRLAMTICALSDHPFSIDWPVSEDQIRDYLQSHEAQWRLLEGPPPDDLHQRVRRLSALLVRARLEVQLENLARSSG